MAGERRVPEFCGGAGGVSDTGEPGPGGGDGWVWALVDAHGRRGVRNRHSAGSSAEDSNVCQSCVARSAVRCLDDLAHGGVAACRESEIGGAAGADGVDPSFPGHGGG